MIIKNDIFNKINIDLSLLEINNPEQVLFLDIETTGLSPRNSSIYMIGLTSFLDNKWTFTGLFAENPSDEINLLNEFIKVLNNYSILIHFNGNRFDLPFLKDRAKNNGINLSFDTFESIDLYKKINSFKHVLGIGNCKQKTIENFLGIYREDKYSGGQLISIYKEYISEPSKELFALLYQHNHDDLLGMLEIIPVFKYKNLLNIIPRFNNIKENEYVDYNGNCCIELMLEYELPISLPSPVSINYLGIFLSIKNNIGFLRIPLKYKELKHFFDNYKDYYYLPKEDMVIHKSISASVDKEYRVKTTKNNCYIHKNGIFIPYFGNNSSVKFKEAYDSKLTYIELTNSFVSDYNNLEIYFHDFLCTAYTSIK